jgi:hypothetical protein
LRHFSPATSATRGRSDSRLAPDGGMRIAVIAGA